MSTVTVIDPVLLEFLAGLKGKGEVLLAGPDGKAFASVRVPDPDQAQLPPGVRSPFGDRELEERRKDKTPGRSLAEIIRDLEARR